MSYNKHLSFFYLLPALLLPVSSAHAQGLQTTYTQRGLATLHYNGVKLVDVNTYGSDGFEIGELSRLRADGSLINEWGGLNFTRSMDFAKQELTLSYGWGTVRCKYIQTTDRLTLQITVTNNHPTETVNGMSIYPMAVRFPGYPAGWDGNTPRVAFNSVTPAVIAANYGSGQVVLTAEERKNPLYAGFFTSAETAATKRYAMWVASAPLSFQPTFWPKLSRRIGPGKSDTYSVSLRFAAASASPYTMAADIYQAYRADWPFQLNWPDRRAIGRIHVAAADQKWPSNPRGYMFDRNVNVFTQAGVADLHRRTLAAADEAVRVLKDMNAQGMVVWDIEGQEYPHMISYIGDPRLLSTLGPEMDGVADAYFKKFRDAGLRVGVGLRPQQFVRNGQGAAQVEVADPAQQLINKITYAKNRWGATLFYIDVNGDTLSPMDATLIMKRVADAHPDILLIPEHEDFKYYAYTAPYMELDLGEVTTPADVAQVYPSAFVVNYVAEEPNLNAIRAKLVAAVRRGDVLMFRGWMNDQPVNTIVKGIYQEAGVVTGDTQAPSASITAPTNGQTVSGTVNLAATAWDNVGVAGVQFRLNGSALGSEDVAAPYTGTWNTAGVSNGTYTLTAVARDAAGNVGTSLPVVVNVSNGPAPDAIPPSVSLTEPAAGSVVSGTVNVSANASDNMGVVGVQFQLDGVNLGAEDLAAPWSVSWNTATASAGTHVLRAVARDAAGNQTTSAAITVSIAGAVSGGLAAHWRMDETGGTQASDATGNQNVGVLMNGPQWTTGRSGGALQFDGGNDYVRVPDSPYLRSSDFTIAMWIQTGSVSGARILFSKPVGPNYSNSYVLYLTDGVMQFHTCCNSPIFGGAALTPGTWQHVAVSKAGAVIRLYLNGNEVGSLTTAPTTVTYDARSLFLGAEDDNGDDVPEQSFFQGKMDDVRFYNKGLSAAEVQQLVGGDTTAPAVAFTAPAAGSTVAGTVTVSAAASDNVGVAGVQFRLDGSPLGGEDTAAPYAVAWNTTGAANGVHTLTAVARDAAGNTSTSAITVMVNNTVSDTTPPSVTLTAPAAGSAVSGTVAVTAVATDNVGVAGVQFRLGGVNLGAEDTSAPYSVNWNTAGLAAGDYTLTAVARDGAGNSRTSAAVTVRIAGTVSGSLQAYWRLNESGGGTVSDSAGGNNGMLFNGPVWTAGRSGGGLSFDGVDDFVRIPDAPGLRSNDFTISLCFRATNVTGERALFAKPFGTSSDNSYLLYLSNGSIRFRTSSSGGGLFYGPIAANAWYHVAVTKTANETRLYLNGNLRFISSSAPPVVSYDNRPFPWRG